jgi:hypothetical protein
MAFSERHEPITSVRPAEVHADVVDRLPAELRSCVHDFGYSVVHAFVTAGVTKPTMIRHLIHSVYLGAREAGNRRPAVAAGKGVLGIMDDVLSAHGAPSIARPIVVTLRRDGMTILQVEPTQDMVAASCAALSNRGTITYEQKHRLRLRAALRCGDKARWGWLDNA